MKAMVLKKLASLETCESPLELVDLPQPVPGDGDGEILVRVSTCGVCHTELDEIEGRNEPPHLPVVLGHQVVGRVETMGREVTGFAAGDRVGVAWIYSACGTCRFCLEGNENLCREFKATGRDANGGYAEYMTVPASFAYPIDAGELSSECTLIRRSQSGRKPGFRIGHDPWTSERGCRTGAGPRRA